MTEELVATHQIISLFERSKSMSDEILDSLSGIFVNIDARGRILRANRTLAESLGLKFEDCLGSDFSKLFTPQNWEIFQANLLAVNTTSANSSEEFELAIQTSDLGARSYLWQISPLRPNKKYEEDIWVYTCVGKDVTEVKEALATVVSMGKDLELTKAMQDLLLPASNEFATNEIELAASCVSAATSGGDLWWIDKVSEKKVWIVVGDVTGHGAGSAMVTSMISGCIETLKAARNSGLIRLDLPMLIAGMNQRLCGLSGRPYWMTVTAIEIDMEKYLVNWWGAASPPIFVYKKEIGTDVLSQASSHIGESEQVALASGTFPFDVGDRILILTDGVSEAKNPKGVQYGLRRVASLLQKTTAMNARELRAELVKVLDAWWAGAAPEDDTTFVIVDRKK